MKKLIIALVIILILTSVFATLVLLKGILANRIKIFLTQKLEHALDRKVEIGGLHISPNNVTLKGISIYRKQNTVNPQVTVKSLKINFSLLSVLKTKRFMPLVYLEDLALHTGKDPSVKNFVVNGAFSVSLKIDKSISKTFASLSSVNKIRLLDMRLFTPLAEIGNIEGDIYLKDGFMKMPQLKFSYNRIPCILSIDSKGAGAGNYIFICRLSSELININADFEKKPEVIKIAKLNGSFKNSTFEYIGEIGQLKSASPVFSLYGKSSVNLPDLGLLSPRLENLITNWRLEGTVKSDTYIKGPLLASPSGWEMGLKSTSDRIKIWDLEIDGFSSDFRMKDGLIETSLLKAYPYNGVLISRVKINTADKGISYDIGLRFDNIDVNRLVRNSDLKNRNIYGTLHSQIDLRGYATDMNSLRGKGNIVIENANLGPMPLLTPLLGSVYGYVQGIIPQLKGIDITSATADFQIADRKIYTNNLTLWGNVITISARGYIDFDKNLDFTVENELREVKQGQAPEWEKTLMGFITNVGKFLGKARLTGTLQKPKWEFQYLNGVTDILKGGLDKILKDIF